MKLSVKKTQLSEAPAIWLRRAGYTYIVDRSEDKESFVRRLSRDFYPRFHMYIEEKKDERTAEDMVTFNLHLDQKRPGYAGQSRHNAEYDGEVVEREMKRLESLITPDIFLA